MQWIFMLIGFAVTAMAGAESMFVWAGGFIGFFIGQAIDVMLLRSRLRKQNRELERLNERLLALEARPQASAPAPVATPVAVPVDTAVNTFAVEDPAAEKPVPEAPIVDFKPNVIVVPRPASAPIDLIWELPAEPTEPPRAEKPADTTFSASDWELEPALAQNSRAETSARERVSVPTEPAPPGAIQRTWQAARGWLFGGNTVLRVGVLLLFLGLAFLLRYATADMVVPVEVRYIGVAAAALALLGLGWWLRLRNPAYALLMQGAGIAVLYLTVFAALRLNPLLDPKAALGLLVAVTVFSAILAVTQDAMGLAVAAVLGGFAAPILTSTGHGSHVGLFSYFALLNAGIFAIAWFKAWRLLNLVGFIGTFGIGFAWGLKLYTPELLSSTEPFLVLFFVMYLAIGLLFARRKLREYAAGPQDISRAALLKWSARQGDYIDGSILFGTPLIGFGLQYALVQHIEFAAAFSALALGLLYLTLARLLNGKGPILAGASHAEVPHRALLLVETCLALGVIFASLAVPLGLSAQWTSAAWAVEGAGLYWLGLRQQRPLARGFAMLLQLGAAAASLSDFDLGETTVLSGPPLGAAMIGFALLFSWWQVRKAPHTALSAVESNRLPGLACLGLGFLYLLAPLTCSTQTTAIAWALAGLVTLFAGLRWQSRAFLFCAFFIQLLGGVLFLTGLHGAGEEGGATLSAGWIGLGNAMLIGLSLIGGMLLAARDSLVRDDPRLLRALSLVLLVGLVFMNLAVLFVLPWQAASAVWAGSGLVIIWLSLHLQQRAIFCFGLALQLIGGAAFLFAMPALSLTSADAGGAFTRSGFWTPMILALAACVGSWRLHRVAQREVGSAALGVSLLRRLADVLLVWGVVWWVFGWCSEIPFVAVLYQPTALVGIALVSVALAALLAPRWQWSMLARLTQLAVPALGILLGILVLAGLAPLSSFGWAAWGSFFAVQYWALWRLASLLPPRMLRVAHVLTCWLLVALLGVELRWVLMSLAEHHNAWRWLGWALIPSVYLLLMAAPRELPWPVRAFPRDYRLWAALPMAVALLAWFWLANIFSDGSAQPLPYVPLLNPLDVGLGIALLSVLLWLRAHLGEWVANDFLRQRIVLWIGGTAFFALCTAMVMRSAYHWAQVPYRLDTQLESMLVQAGLSLTWTLIALALMIVGHLRSRRDVWLTGALLIGVVVAKLFFVELSNRGGLERIVSFIGVGVLLLIIGYFAPLPPKNKDSSNPEEGPPGATQTPADHQTEL